MGTGLFKYSILTIITSVTMHINGYFTGKLFDSYADKALRDEYYENPIRYSHILGRLHINMSDSCNADKDR